MDAATTAPKENFVPGAIYATSGRRPQILRLICVDGERKVLLFKLLEKKWRSAVKDAIEVELNEGLKRLHDGRMQKLGEFVRPKFMTFTDWELEKFDYERAAPTKPNEERERAASEKAKFWLKKRDGNFSLIEELVTPERIAQTYSPRASRVVLVQHAKSKGISLQQLKRLLHKFAWFGLTRNALLELGPLKGATGGTRLSGKKRGRKTDVESLGGRSDLAGLPLLPHDAEIIDQALLDFYVGKHLSLTAVYEELPRYYRAENQYGLFEINPNKIPSFRQFEVRAHKQILKLRLNQLRALHSDKEDYEEARGKDWSIAREVGDIFDTDSTPFNKETIESFGGVNVAVNVGKATVILVIDRRSKKIVGWHVNLKDENWADGYRLALFCAFTSKAEQLKYLKIDAPDAFPENENIICRKLFFDGGPASALRCREALARFGIGAAKAPGETPEAKGGVEGALGQAQNAQADDGGGYRRTNDGWERLKRRLAKKLASDSAYELEQKLVRFIIRHNAALTRRNLLSAEMKSPQHRVMPSSNAIFSWGIKRLGGVEHRRLSDEEVYMTLLDSDYLKVTRNGVRIEGNQYNSAALREKHAQVGKSMKEHIYFSPSRPESAYWITEEGRLDRLERDDDSRSLNGTMTVEEIQFHARLLNVEERLQKEKEWKKRGAKVTKEQHQKMQARAKRKNGVQRTSPTKGERDFRRVAHAVNKAKRPMDADPLAKLVDGAGQESSSPKVEAEKKSARPASSLAKPKPPAASAKQDVGASRRSRPQAAPTSPAVAARGAEVTAPSPQAATKSPAGSSETVQPPPQSSPKAGGSTDAAAKTVADLFRLEMEEWQKKWSTPGDSDG